MPEANDRDGQTAQDVAQHQTREKKEQPIPSEVQFWSKAFMVGVFSVTLVAIYRLVLKPKYQIYNTLAYLPFEPLNNQDCTPLKDIVGCEDQFIDQLSGISYLACTDLAARAHWSPSGLAFDHARIPKPWRPENSPGHLIMYDTRTGKHKRLHIENWPSDSVGLFSTHGMDVFVDRATNPDHPKATIFAINHRPPVDIDRVTEQGADSVVEVFETTLGSDSVRYLRTISDALYMVAPNGIMAVSPTAFYFTNDHAEKVGRLREWEAWINPREGDVIYFDGEKFDDVATAMEYPNGIAKGPGSTFYVASTFRGKVLAFESQSDDSVILSDATYINRALDNIKIMPSGMLVMAALLSLPQMGAMRKSLMTGEILKVPSEVWIMRNDTSEARFYGNKYEILKIFADDGTNAPGVTNAMIYKGELYTTSLYGHLTRCRLPANLTANESSHPQIQVQIEKAEL